MGARSLDLDVLVGDTSQCCPHWTLQSMIGSPSIVTLECTVEELSSILVSWSRLRSLAVTASSSRLTRLPAGSVFVPWVESALPESADVAFKWSVYWECTQRYLSLSDQSSVPQQTAV